jgi:predicted lipoprotein
LSFIVLFIASVIAVAALVALSAWARIERPRAPLTRASALALFDEEFPDQPVEALWIADDGEGAVARSGMGALVAFRIGDGYVARAAPWRAVEQATLRDQMAVVKFGDIAAPKATFRLPESAAWPPRLEVLA